MQFTTLPQGFGAEISDFDVPEGRDPTDIERLRHAFDHRHLLLFRAGGTLPAERQAEIAGWFGPVWSEYPGQNWTVLDNKDAVGRVELQFHCDISYCEQPLLGISLHPLALPAKPTSTTFVSNALGWDHLSPRLQALLRNRTARHYFDRSLMVEMDWPVFEYWHPACLRHPVTGRELLFVTEHHADRIEGLDEAEGAGVLGECFAALYAPERQYEHIWREGDLLVWNNRAIQHARKREADPADGARIVRRVQLARAGPR
jgi:taurine dioxygenase